MRIGIDAMVDPEELLNLANTLNAEGTVLTQVLLTSWDQDDYRERELCDLIANQLVQLSNVRSRRRTKLNAVQS